MTSISPTVIIEELQSIVTHLECPICLSIIEDTHIIPDCSHRFCGPCIKESLRRCNNECPSCRIHVATKRRLRRDDLFDNLIQKLSCIIAESTDDVEGINLRILLDSLKALLWHFQCPLCFNELNETVISSECLHRFCKDCVLNSQATALVGTSIRTNPIESSKCLKCPVCVSNDQTIFSTDKQYESINKAIHFIIKSIEGDVHAKNDGGNVTDGTNVLPMAAVSNPFAMESSNFEYSSIDISSAVPDVVSSEITSKMPTTSGEEDISACMPSTNDTTSAKNSVHDIDGSLLSMNSTVNEVDDAAQPNHNHQNEILKEQIFATGSRFIKTDSQKYGRVVGFDRNLYQVFFPHDKSCDYYTEQDFNTVKFIQEHKRPSQNIKNQKGQERNSDKVLRCPRCTSRFSSNPNNAVSGLAPVQSQNCAHVMCVNCVQALRMDASQKSSTSNNTRKLRATVDCPFCKKAKSFNANDPTICVAMCQMVRLYEDMESQKNEDRIRRKIEEDERQEKQEKKRSEAKKRQRSSKNEKRKDYQRKKDEHERSKRSRIKDSDTKQLKNNTKHLKCKSCKQEKISEKFSTKQLEKIKVKSRPLCRRCEEKYIITKQLGGDVNKVTTTVKVAKKHGSRPKFLTTIVPWNNGAVIRESTPLPPDLIIDGYTRDEWGSLGNSDTNQEECWLKCSFWSTGSGIATFLKFLKEHEKSAYGTFLLPDQQTDGFFVIPFDQPTQSVNTQSNIFQCKYILDLGLLGGMSSNSSEPVAGPSTSLLEQQPGSSLRNLLAAEFKTSQSLVAVPQGSVKAARKLSSRPEGPAISCGPNNWFRQRIVIKEPGDETDTDEEKSSTTAAEDLKLKVERSSTSCNHQKFEL